MSVVYLDTSALLKRYVAETGSSWMSALLAAPNAPVVSTSQPSVAEATCAFARRLRDGTLPLSLHARALLALSYDSAYRCILLDVTPATIDVACRLANKHPMRAYDAIQLSTAWLFNQALLSSERPPLCFVSADDSLVTVAQVEGLLTENPNHHP